jgi:hypothetical protein
MGLKRKQCGEFECCRDSDNDNVTIGNTNCGGPLLCSVVVYMEGRATRTAGARSNPHGNSLNLYDPHAKLCRSNSNEENEVTPNVWIAFSRHGITVSYTRPP